MNKTLPPQPQGSRADQADYWLALLHSPLFDRPQQQAFQHWLATDPENRIALQKAQAFWQKWGTADNAQLALLERRLVEATADQKSPNTAFSSAWLIPALACFLLFIVPGIGFWQALFADYKTAAGEQRLISLSDGSSILLNTASKISVDYSQQLRSVILHSGEAHFKVAKDANRPFEVTTEGGKVRALGTAFDVRQWDGSMTVTVTEHAVSINPKQGSALTRLQEGQRVSINGQQTSPVETVNLKQAMAWQQRLLIFKDQPLRQVVAELSRYRAGTIVIADSTLAKHQVSGVFDASDTETALRTIEKSLRLKEYRLTDRWIVLSR